MHESTQTALKNPVSTSILQSQVSAIVKCHACQHAGFLCWETSVCQHRGVGYNV